MEPLGKPRSRAAQTPAIWGVPSRPRPGFGAWMGGGWQRVVAPVALGSLGEANGKGPVVFQMQGRNLAVI